MRFIRPQRPGLLTAPTALAAARKLCSFCRFSSASSSSALALACAWAGRGAGWQGGVGRRAGAAPPPRHAPLRLLARWLCGPGALLALAQPPSPPHHSPTTRALCAARSPVQNTQAARRPLLPRRRTCRLPKTAGFACPASYAPTAPPRAPCPPRPPRPRPRLRFAPGPPRPPHPPRRLGGGAEHIGERE